MRLRAADSSQPAEKPTAYRGAGSLIGGGLITLFCGFGAIDLAVEAGTRDLTGVSILTLVAVFAALYGVYPAAFAWQDRLVVRNPFRTIELPWSAVTDLSAGLSFIAHTETRRFTVWSIPVSLRDRRKSERQRLSELAQTQRAAKRGVARDLVQPTRPRRPVDPIDRLSFADQAIEEMNARREAYAVLARINATKAASASVAAQPQATQDAVQSPPPESVVATVDETPAATIRWFWPAFAALGASVALLVVAFSVR
jgi:hypothetical protein